MTDAAATPTPDATRPPRPRDVDYAFWLLIVIALLGVAAAARNLFATDQVIEGMRRRAEEARLPVDPAALAAGARGAVITAVVVSVVFAVLTTAFAIKMRQGRNWARLVLTALNTFSILIALPKLGTGDPWALGQLVLAGTAIALMFRPAAKEYFSPR